MKHMWHADNIQTLTVVELRHVLYSCVFFLFVPHTLKTLNIKMFRTLNKNFVEK